MDRTKAAIITGAGRGIGKRVAIGLAEDGYHVGLIARTEEELKETKETIKSFSINARLSPRVLTYPIDVTDERGVSEVIASFTRDVGGVDVLFNNAGTFAPGGIDLNHQDFDRIVEINLKGAFNILKAVVPIMKSRGNGYIFNLASVCGKTGFAGIGGYCASKFGLVGLSESLYRELVPLGIRVTAICPSFVNTIMAMGAPISRNEMIQTEDILHIVRFLLGLGATAFIKEIVVECKSDLQ